jgi:hypothetical protein
MVRKWVREPCSERGQGSHGEPNVFKHAKTNNKLALIRLLILMVQCHPVRKTLTSSLRHLNNQPLVTIPPPMVMPTFVAKNPQPSATTPNISVLEVADPREPLPPSLETTYATPPQGRGAHRHTWRGSLAERLSHTWLGPFH